MIPITKDQTLDIKDRSSGYVWKLRYLTGYDEQIRYITMTNDQNAQIAKARDDAKKILMEKKQVPDPDAISAMAVEIIESNRRNDSNLWWKKISEYIDIFLCGWIDADGKETKPDQPSRLFRFHDALEMYNLVQSNIGELTGLTITEVKN